MFRWRSGSGWWLVMLFGLPVIALLACVIFGGSLNTAGLGSVVIKQLGSIVLVVVIINLWEETLCAAPDSGLAVSTLHQIFDASNKGRLDRLLYGWRGRGNMTQFATVGAHRLGRRVAALATPGVAKRQTPLNNAAREVS